MHIAALKGLDLAAADRQFGAITDRIGLHADINNRISTFSGGMRRRLIFAQAMLGQPRLLALDEPTAELDRETAGKLGELILERARRGDRDHDHPPRRRPRAARRRGAARRGRPGVERQVTAAAIARSSLSTSLARYSRSWGLWLLLLVAPVGARFWIPDENDRTVVISVNDHAPVMTSAMLGVTLGIVITTLLLPVAFIYLRSNATRRQPWQVEEVAAGSRVAVALGRFAADCAILGAVLAAMTLAGWFIAWLVTPLESINLAQITLGLWLIAAPSLMGVAAIRILFDSFPRDPRPARRGALFRDLDGFDHHPARRRRAQRQLRRQHDRFRRLRPAAHLRPSPGRENNFTIGAGKVSAPGRIDLDVMSGLLSEGYVASRFAWAAIAIALAAFAGLAYRPHRPRKERRADRPARPAARARRAAGGASRCAVRPARRACRCSAWSGPKRG